MKKILLALFVCLSALPICSHAQSSRYDYGAVIMTATMDGIANNYATYTAGTVSYERTSECAQSGDCSLKLNSKDFSVGASVQLSMEIPTLYDVFDNCILIDFYVKGIYLPSRSLTYEVRCRDENNIAVIPPFAPEFNIDPADERGWSRVWAVINPVEKKKRVKSIIFNLMYKAFPGERPDAVWIDTISARSIPAKLIVNSVETKSRRIMLDDIIIKGADMNGREKTIYAKEAVKFSVVSGSAYTDENHNLVFNGVGSGRVCAEADFYGVKERFNIDFNEISGAVVQKTENGYSADIFNYESKKYEYELFICVYDGDRLFDVRSERTEVEPLGSGKINIENIKILPCVRQPVIKAFVIEKDIGRQ